MRTESIKKCILANSCEKNKKHFSQATIISILILSHKSVMRYSHRNSTLWPIYMKIKNLDAKTRLS